MSDAMTCKHCGLPIRETHMGHVRNEWEHSDTGMSFCDGKKSTWAWPVVVPPPSPRCELCGQPKNNGWRHAYSSGYGDFATVSCSPPSLQPQEATPASPMRFELYHDVIWYGYIGDSTIPAYSIAHESDGDWCVYPCTNGESGHLFKSPDLEKCKQYLMHNEALSQPYYVVIEEMR